MGGAVAAGAQGEAAALQPDECVQLLEHDALQASAVSDMQNAADLRHIRGQSWQLSHLRVAFAAHNLQADIYLASVYVRLLRTTTEEITGTWLLPEMVSRVASMLDYFMEHLAGGAWHSLLLSLLLGMGVYPVLQGVAKPSSTCKACKARQAAAPPTTTRYSTACSQAGLSC